MANRMTMDDLHEIICPLEGNEGDDCDAARALALAKKIGEGDGAEAERNACEDAVKALICRRPSATLLSAATELGWIFGERRRIAAGIVDPDPAAS